MTTPAGRCSTRHGVEVLEERVVELVGRRGDLRAARLASGRVLPCSLAFFSVAHRPRTDLAQQLGCAIDDEGYVEVNDCGMTTVDGVYAAGDLVPGLQLTSIAAAKGVVAGVGCAQSFFGQPDRRPGTRGRARPPRRTAAAHRLNAGPRSLRAGPEPRRPDREDQVVEDGHPLHDGQHDPCTGPRPRGGCRRTTARTPGNVRSALASRPSMGHGIGGADIRRRPAPRRGWSPRWSSGGRRRRRARHRGSGVASIATST